MIKRNEGISDRAVRFIVGAALLFMSFMYGLSGVVAVFAFGIASILMLTALVGVCPLYSVFGANTCALKKA